jgi:RimJ/RimL family protein N-acetyltransferase
MPETQVFLRPLELDDLDRIHHWHNDAELFESLAGPFRHVSRAVVEEWLRRRTASATDQVNLAICLADTQEHIGNIYIRDIDWIARNAESQMFLGDPAHQSRGLGRAAFRLMIRHAFNDLGLVRLYGPLLEDNTRALRAYQSLGFQIEGRLRKHIFKRGRFVDALLVGLCVDDFSDQG